MYKKFEDKFFFSFENAQEDEIKKKKQKQRMFQNRNKDSFRIFI